MTTTERVAPLPPEERDARQADLVRQAGAELGVYTTLVRHTDLFGDFLPFGRRLLRLSTLTPRERELLIMRAAFRSQAAYEWSHHEVIGRAAGLDDADLDLLSREEVADGDAGPETVRLVRAADELLGAHKLSDASWAAAQPALHRAAAHRDLHARGRVCDVGRRAQLAGRTDRGRLPDPGLARPVTAAHSPPRRRRH